MLHNLDSKPNTKVDFHFSETHESKFLSKSKKGTFSKQKKTCLVVYLQHVDADCMNIADIGAKAYVTMGLHAGLEDIMTSSHQ